MSQPVSSPDLTLETLHNPVMYGPEQLRLAGRVAGVLAAALGHWRFVLAEPPAGSSGFFRG